MFASQEDLTSAGEVSVLDNSTRVKIILKKRFMILVKDHHLHPRAFCLKIPFITLDLVFSFLAVAQNNEDEDGDFRRENMISK